MKRRREGGVKAPTVGTVFWKRIGPIGWVKHEIRAIVDEQMVYRHWSKRWGGVWAYEVDELFIWEKVWLSPADTYDPHVTLDAKVAARLNREHGDKHGT